MYASNSSAPSPAKSIESSEALRKQNFPATILVVEEGELPPHSRLRQQRSSDTDFVMVDGDGKPVPPSRHSEHMLDAAALAGGRSQFAVRMLPHLTTAALVAGGLPGAAIAAAIGAFELSRASKDSSDERKKVLEEIKEEALLVLENHGITVNGALARGFKFAPGHPRTHVSYRVHPLAELSGGKHAGHYIPQDSFDQTLLEEREAELLRLLVELGATRIVISEKHSNKEKTVLEAALQAEASKVAEFKASASHGNTHHGSESNSREFLLVGKPSRDGEEIDEARFAWLRFEPSWQSLVQARQVGQCAKATLELKEETSYSNETKVQAALRFAGRGGSASAKYAGSSESTTTYTFRVEFGPFAATPAQ